MLMQYLLVQQLADYSGYPDCRPEYFKAFQKMADLATKKGVNGKNIQIITPVLKLNKSEIIKKGLSLMFLLIKLGLAI